MYVQPLGRAVLAKQHLMKTIQNLYLSKHHPLIGLLTHSSEYIFSPYCHHHFLYQIIGADYCARIFSLVLVSDRSFSYGFPGI